MRTVLVVAAHPDDEVLGCGGTIAWHVGKGDEVHVLFMTDGVSSRDLLSNESKYERNKSAYQSCEVLGAQKPNFLGFPDNRMDTVGLLDVIKEIEKVIDQIQPLIIYTHHGGDLNIDHQITHQATLTACRPQPESSVYEIYSFEILSSTEWASPSVNNAFIPNRYVDISTVMEHKLEALNAYAEEIRKYPHSRSIESVVSLMKVRGSSMGLIAAESFKVERILVK